MRGIARGLTRFTRTEIQDLFSSAVRVNRNRYLDILCKKASLAQSGRILIVVSKKNGCAVVRNKIRRKIKSIFYEQQLYKGLYDWLVIVRRASVSADFNELVTVLVSVMKVGE